MVILDLHSRCHSSLRNCLRSLYRDFVTDKTNCTHCNTEMEREKRSRGLPFSAERHSQDEMRRRENLQQSSRSSTQGTGGEQESRPSSAEGEGDGGNLCSHEHTATGYRKRKAR